MHFEKYLSKEGDGKLSTNNELTEIIYDAIDDLNELLPPEQTLNKTEDTVLFGGEGKLDSLGLVTFIVAVEQKISEKYQTSLALADEKAMSMMNSPFRTTGTLAAYIEQRLAEGSNE